MTVIADFSKIRTFKHIECVRPACWNQEFDWGIGPWANADDIPDFCMYTAVECTACKAKYWLVLRDKTASITYRTSDTFDHRKQER